MMKVVKERKIWGGEFLLMKRERQREREREQTSPLIICSNTGEARMREIERERKKLI